jgi:CelD/BcsL family acetyltransferase involved in cellulose biosynthesis
MIAEIQAVIMASARGEHSMSAVDLKIRSDAKHPSGSAAVQARSEAELPLLGNPGLDPAETQTCARLSPECLATPIAAADAPGIAPHCGISLSVYHDLSETGAEWRAFERQADHTVFQSFDWLAHWQRHVGAQRGTVPAIVVGRDTDGELLFILQLAIEKSSAARRLAWLGSALCDYNAPLIGQRFSAHVSAERFLLLWRDAIALLQSDPRFHFDLIDLEKMPESIGEQRNPFIDLDVRTHPSGAYVADLPGHWDELYAAKRSAATRKRERRQLRALAEHGKVCFVEVEDSDERTRTLATLLEQKSRVLARMGVVNPFLSPGHREFYLAMAGDPALRDLVHVSRLDVGHETAAASVGLKFRNCYYLILSSYDAGKLARFGPGRAHLHELLRHAIAQEFDCFDFTVGDEPYKHDWADRELKLHDHLAAVTLRGALVAAVTVPFRRAKRAIKQSPGLWQAFCRARALAGRHRAQ